MSNESVINLPLEKLNLHRSSMQGAYQNVARGKASRTVGPISVWHQPETDSYLLSDGHHRLIDHLLRGGHGGTVPAIVTGSGYNDYDATPLEGNKLKLNPKLRYGGLESLADKSLLASDAKARSKTLGKSEEFSYPETRVASVAVTNAEGKVLFGLRRDHGLWTLPGGHLEDGEAPVRGAVRELLEETNLTPVEITFLGEGLVEADGKKLRIFCFKMTVEGEPSSINDPDQECSQWVWVDCVDGIPANIYDHLYSPNNVVLKYVGLQRGTIVDDSYDTLRRDVSQMAELQKADTGLPPVPVKWHPDEPFSANEAAENFYEHQAPNGSLTYRREWMPVKGLGFKSPKQASSWLQDEQKMQNEARIERGDPKSNYYSEMESWYKKNWKQHPIIITHGGAKGPHDIQDGWHRVAMAHKLGMTHVPAIVGYPKLGKLEKDELPELHRQALASISRMKPEHKALATAWYHYTQGHQQHRPTITPALERHMAKFGIVDPAGYPYTETGRDMQRPIGGKKVFNQQPDALKQHKQNSNSLDYSLPFQRAEQELLWDTLVKEELELAKMALVHDDPERPKFVYRVENDKGIGPYQHDPKEGFSAEGMDNSFALHRIGAAQGPVPQKDFEWEKGEPIRSALYGFAHPKQAYHWFGGMAGMGFLQDKGYKLMRIPASKIWSSQSGRQVLFHPHPTAPKVDAHAAGLVDSVGNLKENLNKNKPGPVFPKLGVPDNRRETLLATRPQAALQNKLAMHSAYQSQHFNPQSAQTVRVPSILGESKDDYYARGAKAHEDLFNRRKFGNKKGTFTSPTYRQDMRQVDKMTDRVHGASALMKPTTTSYALQNKDRRDAGMSRQSNTSDLATVLHEDFHNVMTRTRKRYGHEGQRNLSSNLLSHLKQKDQRAFNQLRDYFTERTGMSPDDPSYEEEHIAHLLNYLNDPAVRRNYLQNATSWIEVGERQQAKRAIDKRMKSAYRHIVHGALTADPTWVLEPKHKALLDEHKKTNPHITAPASDVGKNEGYYDTDSGNTDMSLIKGLKGAIAGAMMLGAAAHAGSPAPKAPEHGSMQHAQSQQQAPTWNKEGLHYEMYPIGKLESNNGTMLNHEPSKNGPFHTAYGPLGFKPSSAYEEFKTSPRLQAKYQGNDDADKFLKNFQSNPTFYNEIASHHWNRLKKLAGGISHRAAFGWRWGPGKLQTASPEEIDNDPYVKKYRSIVEPQIAMMKFQHEATVLYKAQREASWKGGDISIPKTGTAERKDYDTKYVDQLKNVFAQNGQTLKRLVVPTAHINAFSGNMPVNKERLNLYHRMARAGDRLPPIVVRRHSNNLFDIVDGSHRYAAAMRAGLPHLEAYELIHPLDKSELDAKRVPKSYVGEFNGLSVYLVDGAFIRNNVDIEYTEGGNHERYKWIPADEIWLENTGNQEDVAACAVHEYYELTLMGHGMDYDHAHDKASAVEKKFRTEHENEPVLLPQAALWYEKHVETA